MKDEGTAEVMWALRETLAGVVRTESAACRLCGHIVRGTSFGEILRRLGVHGDQEHADYFGAERAKWRDA